jgi:hypothetical protein
MSSFIADTSGAAGVGGANLGADDGRLRPEWFDDDGWRWITNDDPWSLKGWVNEWWPGLVGMDASGGEWLQSFSYDQIEFTSGSVGRYIFTGVTRDVNGTILGGAVVKLFKTADANGSPAGGCVADTKLDQCISDPFSGAFTLGSPFYPDTHYIVAYKAGSPDAEGTSVNTLIGT